MIAAELHRWKGRSWSRTDGRLVVVMGWLTIARTRESLFDQLRDLRRQLDELHRRLSGG